MTTALTSTPQERGTAAHDHRSTHHHHHHDHRDDHYRRAAHRAPPRTGSYVIYRQTQCHARRRRRYVTVAPFAAKRLPGALLRARSAPRARRALRVIRPCGELRHYEHVRADTPGLARVQAGADRIGLSRLLGNEHFARRTKQAIRAAGFEVERERRFRFQPSPLDFISASHVLGVARRPER